MLAFWEQSAYFQSVWGNTMFQTLMKIISAYPLKFQISSEVSGRKGWEPSQNSSWLVTGHLVWVVGTVFKSTSCIISSVNGSYGMLWMQLFLPPVKPEYCALAICGWGIDKISKHMEWLSLPQHLTLFQIPFCCPVVSVRVYSCKWRMKLGSSKLSCRTSFLFCLLFCFNKLFLI